MHIKLFFVGLLATLAIASPLAHSGHTGIEARQKKVSFDPAAYKRVDNVNSIEARQKKVSFDPAAYKRVDIVDSINKE